jgi:acyl carrier protein
MSATPEDIHSATKAFILEEFLPGEDPAALDDTTPLISTGILDSIATVRLVAFLEERFGIEMEAHEMSADRLDTLPEITRTVTSKLKRG